MKQEEWQEWHEMVKQEIKRQFPEVKLEKTYDFGKKIEWGNLETIENGLKLIQTNYRTKQGLGEIDILCRDINGKYVVIEVKRWKDSDKVMGQILRYMGAIKEERGSEPRGIIILNHEDKRLNYAKSIVKNIETKYYKFDFAISDKPA